eukprot:3847796-Rhodomonas_salina.7
MAIGLHTCDATCCAMRCPVMVKAFGRTWRVAISASFKASVGCMRYVSNAHRIAYASAGGLHTLPQ